MKKTIKLNERELTEIIKQIVTEDMEFSSNLDKNKWLSVKNKIPNNVPKMSLGALMERLMNDGYGNVNIEEPFATIKLFPYQEIDNQKEPTGRYIMLMFDPLDKKWYELTK